MSVAPSTIELTNKQKEAPMDQTAVTIVNATEDFLKSQIQQKDARIVTLEEHSQRVTQRDFDTRAKLEGLRNDMQEWTFNAIESGTINEDEALEIAEICGFELTKEFEVEVTVMYSITINARDEESAQNAIHDIDFDTVQYDSDNISWLSSSVDRIEI
jgi:hypothetical protein